MILVPAFLFLATVVTVVTVAWIGWLLAVGILERNIDPVKVVRPAVFLGFIVGAHVWFFAMFDIEMGRRQALNPSVYTQEVRK